MLLRIPRDYDLVLELDSLASRRKFIAKLEAFLASQKKHFTLTPIARDIMLAKAETKERRQKKLEQVRSRVCTFMNAYAASLSINRLINTSERNNSLIDKKGKEDYGYVICVIP